MSFILLCATRAFGGHAGEGEEGGGRIYPRKGGFVALQIGQEDPYKNDRILQYHVYLRNSTVWIDLTNACEANETSNDIPHKSSLASIEQQCLNLFSSAYATFISTGVACSLTSWMHHNSQYE